MDIFDKTELYFKEQKQFFGDYIFYESVLSTSNQEINFMVNEEEHHSSKVKSEQGSTAQFHKNTTIEKETAIKDAIINEEWQKAETIDELRELICNCKKCALGNTRTNFVFGVGNPNAGIMVIGEAPGAEEDAQGEPFVGRAGQLLTKILAAINLPREEVFIANILKCRPPDNRKPLTSETDLCEPYLKKQIELIKPKFILALGLTAVDTLLKKPHKMAETRGKLFDYCGTKMLVTYHPSALLRNPNLKPAVWEDVKLLRRLYDESIAGGN
ncbi:MAG: Bacteriophage-type polymerase [Ignavibacteria bacterium]|nr:Bacteriophage-type polymerase [Ignavibacteria bacterium]